MLTLHAHRVRDDGSQLILQRGCCGTHHGGWRVLQPNPGELALAVDKCQPMYPGGAMRAGSGHGRGGIAEAAEEDQAMLKIGVYMEARSKLEE